MDPVTLGSYVARITSVTRCCVYVCTHVSVCNCCACYEVANELDARASVLDQYILSF